MSGFVCILHGNDAPIDRGLLQSLTDFLSFRGPDARNTWTDGSIGMGHALLRTSFESKDEQQPLSLEGRFWIVADARLDARQELIHELQNGDQTAYSDSPDCELILRDYAAWGEACTEHLRGDFSFAIWDKEHKKLFCTRDHFGIKPFYYANIGSLLILSNTLNCIRLHPRVGDELNEMAVGDFLLFGLNYDNATTIFHDIQRLPPAHALTFATHGLRISRYWAPPTDGRIRYAKPNEYVENFQTIFEKAVGDRLHTDRAAILLSGGLDSSSVAAVAEEVSAREARPTELRAYTHVYESLIPHDDGEFAKEVAECLDIPIKFIALDWIELFEGWDDPDVSQPQPVSNPLHAGILDSYGVIASDCRTVMSGEGGDNLLHFEIGPYLQNLRREREWPRLVTEIADYLCVRPFPWRGIWARLQGLARIDPYRREFPKYLTPEFEREKGLRERWRQSLELPKSWMMHPIHPRGYASLYLPQWTLMFEQEDPGATGFPLEIRYPFMDLRVVNYLLAIPPYPWFFKKALLREAMAGRLPERVRGRPKTPLQKDPVLEQIRRAGNQQLRKVPLGAELDRYVARPALIEPRVGMSAERVSTYLRPYTLNIWLQSARRFRYNICGEVRHG